MKGTPKLYCSTTVLIFFFFRVLDTLLSLSFRIDFLNLIPNYLPWWTTREFNSTVPDPIPGNGERPEVESK